MPAVVGTGGQSAKPIDGLNDERANNEADLFLASQNVSRGLRTVAGGDQQKGGEVTSAATTTGRCH